MPRHEDEAYVEHILSAAASVQAYVQDMDFMAFAGDSKTQHAVLYDLAVIGEAARHISLEFQNAHPNIPWRDIIGMRNVVIHEYFGVDLEEVWKAATQDIPKLLADLGST